MVPEVHSLVALLYEAAATPSLYSSALFKLADLAGCAEVTLSLYDKATLANRSGMLSGRVYAPETAQAYREYYNFVEPLRERALRLPGGTLVLSHEHDTREIVDRSEFYQEFLIPSGGRYYAGWVLEYDAVLATFMLHTRREPPRRVQLERWTSIAGHVRSSLTMAQALSRAAFETETVRQVCKFSGLTYVVVDADCRPIEASPEGAAALDRGEPIAVRGGRLQARDEESSARLRQLVARAARGLGGGVLRAPDKSSDGWTVLQVAPVGVAIDNPFNPGLSGAAVVMVRSATHLSPLAPGEVRRLIGCTPAEAEVAAALAAGLTPARIAAQRCVSLNTVRTQIQSLLAATGTSRIVELVALFERLRTPTVPAGAER